MWSASLLGRISARLRLSQVSVRSSRLMPVTYSRPIIRCACFQIKKSRFRIVEADICSFLSVTAGFDSLCRPAAGEGPRSKRPLSPMLGCSCPTDDALLWQSWELTDLILSFDRAIQPIPVASNRGGTG